jgi:hypothetical protein
MPIKGSFAAGSVAGFGGRGGFGPPYFVQYLILAGGGSGGYSSGPGGGAGGYRTIACKTYEVQKGRPYEITVGAGGGAQVTGSPNDCNSGQGFLSSFADIESAGGGGVGNQTQDPPNYTGGSGSGGFFPSSFAGNVPPVSPPQGNPGGEGFGGAHTGFQFTGGGGGGSGGSGSSRNGGPGSSSSITGTSVPRAGGGGGGGNDVTYGTACTSSGAKAGRVGNDTGETCRNAITNTGSGGGGGGNNAPTNGGGAGGSGIIVIRRLTSDGGPKTGGGQVTTSGGDTIHTFLSPGTYTA